MGETSRRKGLASPKEAGCAVRQNSPRNEGVGSTLRNGGRGSGKTGGTLRRKAWPRQRQPAPGKTNRARPQGRRSKGQPRPVPRRERRFYNVARCWATPWNNQTAEAKKGKADIAHAVPPRARVPGNGEGAPQSPTNPTNSDGLERKCADCPGLLSPQKERELQARTGIRPWRHLPTQGPTSYDPRKSCTRAFWFASTTMISRRAGKTWVK